MNPILAACIAVLFLAYCALVSVVRHDVRMRKLRRDTIRRDVNYAKNKEVR